MERSRLPAPGPSTLLISSSCNRKRHTPTYLKRPAALSFPARRSVMSRSSLRLALPRHRSAFLLLRVEGVQVMIHRNVGTDEVVDGLAVEQLLDQPWRPFAFRQCHPPPHDIAI